MYSSISTLISITRCRRDPSRIIRLSSRILPLNLAIKLLHAQAVKEAGELAY